MNMMHHNLYFSSLFIFLTYLARVANGDISSKVGVCYGQLGNNLPTPTRSVDLIKALNAKRVKLYDANPEILKALENTDLQVSVMVPNDVIPRVSTNQTLADEWVKSNVVPFYPKTKIRYLLVGNEILSNPPNSTWTRLVPAMKRIRYSVKRFGLRKIKVGTPLAMDALEASFPPSSGAFRSDVREGVIKPLLRFLNQTKSFYFLDAYPYFPWSTQPGDISLDYALMEPNNVTYTDPGSNLTYTNLLDQMLDATIFAMKRVGYPDVRLFVAETGWPNGCDFDQIGGNLYNAATYNRNVIKKVTAKPAVGTPARPGAVLPAFIFALYNENLKPGPGTERHFGLLYPNGTNVYPVDLSGKMPASEYAPLPEPTNNVKYKGKIWCVVRKGANQTAVAGALDYACGQGNRTCDAIRPGGNCYKPRKSLIRHASYAFSSYWAQLKTIGATCDFNGLATQTIKDPSYGSCKFPSVTL